MSTTSVQNLDMKLEVIVIPVSDVDRAKEFYERLGWRLDADFVRQRLPDRPVHAARLAVLDPVRHGHHVGGPRLGPGPVPDRLRHRGGARRARRQAASTSSEVFHDAGGGYNRFDRRGTRERSRAGSAHATRRSLTFSDPDGNGWLLQEITTRLPGRIDAGDDDLRHRERSGERDAAGVGGPRRAREARSAAATRTGPTGTPSTWSASRPEKSCRTSRT